MQRRVNGANASQFRTGSARIVSRDKTFIDCLRRWKGILAVWLILLQGILLAGAVVPQVHSALHGHDHEHDRTAAGDSEHHCLVVDLAAGQLDSAASAPLVVGIDTEVSQVSNVRDVGVLIPSPVLSFLLDRGPPA